MTGRWELARGETKRLVQGIEPGLADLLAEDPFESLKLAGITVRLRPEELSGDGCSVDGSYKPGRPPTITIAETRSVVWVAQVTLVPPAQRQHHNGPVLTLAGRPWPERWLSASNGQAACLAPPSPATTQWPIWPRLSPR